MFAKRRAQSTLEYTLIITAAVVAVLAVRVYMKRCIQGRLRASSDQIGEHFEPNSKYSRTDKFKSHTITTEHDPAAGGAMTRVETINDFNIRSEEESWEAGG